MSCILEKGSLDLISNNSFSVHARSLSEATSSSGEPMLFVSRRPGETSANKLDSRHGLAKRLGMHTERLV